VREVLREAKMRTLGDQILGGAEDFELSSVLDKIRATAATALSGLSGGTGARRPTSLRALIIGDSQVGSALGSELELRLEALGYSVTREDAMVGKPSSTVVDAALPKVGRYTVVFAIYGGNDSSANAAIANTQRLYDRCADEGVLLVVIGPGPATRATSLDSVRRGWGSPSGAATDAEGAEITLDYQLTRSGGNYDEQRVEISNAIDSFGEDKSGVATYGIATQYQSYPDQPDGLHIFNGASGIVDDIFEKLEIEDLTQDLKDELEATRYQALTSDYTPSVDPGTLADPAHYATIQLGDVPDVYTRKFEAGTTAYDNLIDAAGLRHGVPPAFIKAIMNVESNFSPTAASRAPNDKPGWGPDGTTLKEGGKMAVGLMQFIWPTGVSYGLCAGDGNGGVRKDDRTDPPAAIDAGARFIKNLWEKFGNWPQVAAAYNSGPGNVPGGKWTAFPEMGYPPVPESGDSMASRPT
jgi:hypothetical protein